MIPAKGAASPATGSFWYSLSKAPCPSRARIFINASTGRACQLTTAPASISAWCSRQKVSAASSPSLRSVSSQWSQRSMRSGHCSSALKRALRHILLASVRLSTES